MIKSFCCLGALLILGLPAVSQEVLTVDAVVQMVKTGISEKAIIQRVRNHPGHYGLTTQKMVELRRSGVPASVLSEMLEKDEQGQSQITKSEPALNACQAVSQEWVTATGNDPLTNAPFVAAEKISPAGSGACVRVTASCKTDPNIERLNDSPLAAANPIEAMIRSGGIAPPDAPPESQPRKKFDARTLEFLLQYSPSVKSRLSLLASLVNVPPSACVRMRVMVDDFVKEGVASDRCNVQNLASVSFPAVSQISAFTSIGSPVPGGNAEMNALYSQVIGKVAAATDPTVATMQQALKSQQIKIELPFTDGTSAIVEIKPQELSFKRFVASCFSTFPNPSTSPSAPLKPPSPPAPVDTFVSETADTLASRTFVGTIDQFAAELPAYIERALIGTHLPPRNYNREISHIIDNVRACLSVTPQMVASTRKVKGLLMKGEWGPRYSECGQPDDGRPLWGAYAINVTDKVGGGGSDYSRRDLLLRINPIGGFASGQGIAVTVFFEFRSSDTPSFANNLDLDPTHRIVFAKVTP